MAELVPYPLPALLDRAWRELDERGSLFDLPARAFFHGDPRLDFSTRLHGRRVGSPLGPAAGPHSQMAQNIALAWLGGCRVFELKTVQINDRLTIPRPCIDARTVGFNVEWSQELTLEQSLEEYVKAAMLVEMLAAGPLPPLPGFAPLQYDLSVGYDLAGIRSDRVLAFLRGALDCRPTLTRLRREIPRGLAHLRDLPFPERLSDTLTLSTFHGCPPDEIERIIRFLLEELRLHCVVKLNPMLLGPEETRHLLHDALGYDDLEVPDSAFARDTRWPQAVEIVARLAEVARGLDLGFGIKLSNTLIVRNPGDFLPATEREVYLSGAPLHVLAMALVRRFRGTFGPDLPISFSAGIDRHNFPDAAALGLAPITVCTDLLRKGGYGRLRGYHEELARRMAAVGAGNLDDFTLRAYGQGSAALDRLGLPADHPALPRCRAVLAGGGDLRRATGDDALHDRWLGEARRLDTEHYVARAIVDPRYGRERNRRAPRKIGRHLVLFDCLTCDICVPVCPNDANFTLPSLDGAVPVVKLERHAGGWSWRREGAIDLAERHQIANFADFCNDCGNCDVFCPEDGGPYLVKPRFFGHEGAWREAPHLDGFHLGRRADRDIVLGRFAGREYRLEVAGAAWRCSGPGFDVTFDAGDPEASLGGEATGEVDLTFCFILDYLRRALLAPGEVNYVSSLCAGGLTTESRR